MEPKILQIKWGSKPSVASGVRQASSIIPAAYTSTPLAFWPLLLSASPFSIFLSTALITLNGARGTMTERSVLCPGAMERTTLSYENKTFAWILQWACVGFTERKSWPQRLLQSGASLCVEPVAQNGCRVDIRPPWFGPHHAGRGPNGRAPALSRQEERVRSLQYMELPFYLEVKLLVIIFMLLNISFNLFFESFIRIYHEI